MLTVKNAAEILNISSALVYALCAQGSLEHERYGIGRGTIRISEQALAAFQERMRVGAPAPTPRPTRTVLKHLTLKRGEPAHGGIPDSATNAGTSSPTWKDHSVRQGSPRSVHLLRS